MWEYMHRWRAHLGLDSRRRALGLSFMVAVALIWVVASFLVQGIEEHGVHPITLTFISNSILSVFIPVYYLSLRLKKNRIGGAGVVGQVVEPVPQIEQQSLFPQNQTTRSAVLETSQERDVPAVEQTSLRQLLKTACVVAPIWCLAEITYNASLDLTSVTSNTILSSTSALFTFVFAVALLSEQFTLFKLGCISLLVAGTAMVTSADAGSSQSTDPDPGGSHRRSHDSVIGDVLVLFSAVCYGCYTTAIRRMLGEDDERVPMSLFFGLLGALIFSVGGLVLALLRIFGVHLGTLTWRTFGLVVAKGLLDNVISDYLWARAIMLIGPTLATSGLSLQVPIAVALDAIFRHPPWMSSVSSTLLTLLGGVVVLTGFLGINASEEVSDGGQGTRAGIERAQVLKSWESQAASVQAELELDISNYEDDDSGLDDDVGYDLQRGRTSPHNGSTRYAVRPAESSVPP